MNELKFSKRKQLQNNIYGISDFKKEYNKEIDLQRQCEQYLQLVKVPFIRIPDQVYKSIFGNTHTPPYLKRLVSQFLKGLPDLIVMKKQDDKHCLAICIELKTSKGKLSQGQKNFAKELPLIVIRNFDDFVKLIEEFMK